MPFVIQNIMFLELKAYALVFFVLYKKIKKNIEKQNEHCFKFYAELYLQKNDSYC